jgi:hypothetical protein
LFSLDLSATPDFMKFWKRLRRVLFALQSGPAHRVIFYYFGEDPTYLEDAFVTVYRNGVVEVIHRNEHVSTHAQNVEILWKGRGSTGHKGRHLSLVKSENLKN